MANVYEAVVRGKNPTSGYVEKIVVTPVCETMKQAHDRARRAARGTLQRPVVTDLKLLGKAV